MFVLGSDPILNGYYKNRHDAVEKCAHVAKSRGYQLFTIQNGGFCSSGPMAHRTFQIYGPASKCKGGLGGKWASDVYIFNGKSYQPMMLSFWYIDSNTLYYGHLSS